MEFAGRYLYTDCILSSVKPGCPIVGHSGPENNGHTKVKKENDTWDKHTKPRPGGQSDKKKEKPNWNQKPASGTKKKFPWQR